MTTQRLFTAIFIALSATFIGCADTKLGGKSLRESFPNSLAVDLVSASNDGDFRRANELVQQGADVNAIGSDGISPLLWIMGTTRSTRSLEYLLKSGANPNYIDAKSQVSAMYFAAGGDRPDILELLLTYKGDPNLLGPRGESLLMVAVGQFQDKNMELLLKHGANMNYIDRHHETVADKAAGYGRFDLVVRLLEMGLSQDMQALAKTVEVCKVPAASEQQRWKDRVIEMLKARGAKFPAFVPSKP